jgi:predicted DNA-binding transcriptional regulator AlpA
MNRTPCNAEPRAREHVPVAERRLLRLAAAADYLSMSQRLFNAAVRPHVATIRLGPRAIAFDRLELDAWVDRRRRTTIDTGTPDPAPGATRESRDPTALRTLAEQIFRGQRRS